MKTAKVDHHSIASSLPSPEIIPRIDSSVCNNNPEQHLKFNYIPKLTNMSNEFPAFMSFSEGLPITAIDAYATILQRLQRHTILPLNSVNLGPKEKLQVSTRLSKTGSGLYVLYGPAKQRFLEPKTTHQSSPRYHLRRIHV